jgi:hypothetical protein
MSFSAKASIGAIGAGILGISVWYIHLKMRLT